MFAADPVLVGVIGGGGGPGVQPLQFINVYDRFARGTIASSGTQLKWWARIPVLIGSGDVSEFRWNLSAYKLTTTDFTANANAFTIEQAAFEKVSGGAAYAQLFFDGGSASRVMATNDNDVSSDAVLPSAFGLTKFTRGEQYFVRCLISVVTAGHVIPSRQYFQANVANAVCVRFDPATASPSNPVLGTGSMNGTGSGFTAGQDLPPFACLGKFVSGSPKVFIGIGDSIMNYTNDSSAASPSISGFFSTSMVDADGISNPRACMNFAIGSGNAISWNTGNQAAAAAYLKYANVCVEEYGTNDLSQWANSAAIHTLCKAQTVPLLVVRTKLIPKTTDPVNGNWTTEAGQSYVANFGPAGTVDTFNGNVVVGGNIDYTIDFTGLRGGADHKWAVDGTANKYTADGIHPTSYGHRSIMAVAMRNLYASNSW